MMNVTVVKGRKFALLVSKTEYKNQYSLDFKVS